MAPRRCKRCGHTFAPTTPRNVYCGTDCSRRARGQRTRAGRNPYGWTHQQERARLIAKHHPGDPCPLCGKPMTDPTNLDVDHTPALWAHDHRPGTRCCTGRLTCAACNRSKGAREGNWLRQGRLAPPPPRTSRDW